MITFSEIIQKKDHHTPPSDRENIDELGLVVQAMWEVLKSRFDVTDEELKAKMDELLEAADQERAFIVEIRGGRVKCPACKKVFSLRDSTQWDGECHLLCGTRLKLEDRGRA